MTTRKLAVLAAAVFGTLVAMLVLWELRSILLLFMVSLLVSAMVRRPVDRLIGWRVPQGLAVAFVFLIGIGIAAAVLFVTAPILVQQASALVQELNEAYSRQYMSVLEGAGRFQALLSRLLPRPSTLGLIGSGMLGELPLGAAVNVTGTLFEALAQSLLVIVLSVYWMADRMGVERLWLSLLPPERRNRAREITRAMGASVGAYLRSEAAQTLLAGMLLFTGFSMLGIKYALLLAVIAALAWLIPIVGTLFAVVPVGVIALLSGPVAAASAVGVILIVFALLEFVVERRLYKRRRYGSLWAVLIALAMLDVFGLLGLVLAPVIASVAQIGIEEGLRHAPAAVAKSVPMLSALRTRVAEAHAELDRIENPSPRTAGLLDRLDNLLEKAEQMSWS